MPKTTQKYKRVAQKIKMAQGKKKNPGIIAKKDGTRAKMILKISQVHVMLSKRYVIMKFKRFVTIENFAIIADNLKKKTTRMAKTMP